MKKLMFALIAGVAVSAAQAVDVFAEGEGFEGAAVDAAATTLEKFSYVPSSQSQDDSKVASEVSAFDGKRALYFSTNGVSNTKYLNLSTDGGVLYRSINAPANENPIGEARALTQSFYIDTLVQFTVCDSAPTIDSGAKLAIWLQASDDESTTNLMVKAKLWEVAAAGANAAGFTSLGSTNLVLSGSYDAGTWYRLTVEAVPNLFTKANGRYATGFKVKINGSEVQATNGGSFVLAGGESATLAELLARHANADEVTAMTSGSVFASIADTAADVDNSPSIAAVGFSGTGLVDEILFTDYNPDVPPVDVFDFTITLNTGVSAVSYTISGSTNGTIGATTTLEALPAGTTVTLSGLTGSGVVAADWEYQAAAVGTPVNCSLDGLVATLDGNPQTPAASVTVGLATKTVETADEVTAAVAGLELSNAIATYIGTDVAKYAAFTTWASGNNYDVERVNSYAYTLDRMTNNLPITASVVVSFNADITNEEGVNDIVVEADALANAEVDGAVSYEDKKIYLTVDAGYGFTVSNLALAEKMGLETNASAEGWNLNNMEVVLGEGTVRFVTTLDAGKGKAQDEDPDASASIATKSTAVYYTAVELNKASTSLVTNETETLTATFTPAAPVADDTYTWASSATAVATVDQNGVVTAVGAGTATITVTATHDPTVTASCTVTVTAPVYYTAISLNKATTSLVTNETETLTATLTPAEAADDSVTWTSSDDTVATVAGGVVTAVGAGTATITAATRNYSATCTVTVTAPEPTPAVTPVDPSAGGEATYADAAAATSAANTINSDKETNIPLPDELKSMDSSAKGAYYERVEAVANGTKVTIEFTSDGETVAQTSADTAATAVAAELGEVAASVSGGEANIATVPGFYYSILYKASLDASWTEKLPRVLGTGTAVPIAVPKAGTAGFYQLKVSPVGKAE